MVGTLFHHAFGSDWVALKTKAVVQIRFLIVSKKDIFGEEISAFPQWNLQKVYKLA